MTDIGRALPPAYTNRPTSVLIPECSISSQDGSDFPFDSMTISHRPSTASALDAFMELLRSSARNTAVKRRNLCVDIFLMNFRIKDDVGNIRNKIKFTTL
jgi:hypothetical protein